MKNSFNVVFKENYKIWVKFFGDGINIGKWLYVINVIFIVFDEGILV